MECSYLAVCSRLAGRPAPPHTALTSTPLGLVMASPESFWRCERGDMAVFFRSRPAAAGHWTQACELQRTTESWLSHL